MSKIAKVINLAAVYYYATNPYLEDQVVDPADSMEVLRRYFTAGDNDDFAWLLAQMTGFQTLQMTWDIPDLMDGRHSLVRTPDGRYLDIHGWSTEAELRRRFWLRKDSVVTLKRAKFTPTFGVPVSEDVIPEMARLAAVIRNLPYEPFDTPEFQKMSRAAIPGVDPKVATLVPKDLGQKGAEEPGTPLTVH